MKQGEFHVLGIITETVLPMVSLSQKEGVTQRLFADSTEAQSAYKEVIGAAREKGWEIQFQGVPNWG